MMKVRGHRNSTSGTMKVREWYKNAEGHLCTASIFCKAALWEVNHQQVHRRCSSSNDLTMWVTILLQHVKDQQCVSRSWALNILFFVICWHIMCFSGLQRLQQWCWSTVVKPPSSHHDKSSCVFCLWTHYSVIHTSDDEDEQHFLWWFA